MTKSNCAASRWAATSGRPSRSWTGLGPTDRVILNPPDSLVSGTTVRVAQATEEPAGKEGRRTLTAK